MRARPIHAAALRALAKTLGMNSDVGRHPCGDRRARRLGQLTVAARTARQKPRRVGAEIKPCAQLPDESVDSPAPEQQDARSRFRGEVAVAGQQPATFGPGQPRKHGVRTARQIAGVEPGEAQPAGKRAEHGVARKTRSGHHPILGPCRSRRMGYPMTPTQALGRGQWPRPVAQEAFRATGWRPGQSQPNGPARCPMC